MADKDMFDSLQKTDLYRVHQMSKDFDGGCISVDIDHITLQNDDEVYLLLDAICRLDKLQPISSDWRKLTYDEGKAMLFWAFQNDLAYDGTRLGKKKTQKYCKLILNHVDPETSICFTNWFDDPWKEGGGRSWSGISKNTFDIAVVVMDKKKLVLTYLTSED